jgi:aminoglycoside phosphotransferase (APT) family kinase protein
MRFLLLLRQFGGLNAYAIGQPSINYPWNWAVYQWIEGENARPFLIDDLQLFALNLAQFLKELHTIDTTGGPLAGAHNFYRGGSPLVYDAETRSAISQLGGLFDMNAVTAVWERAISSKWTNNPVWIHGDFSAGNILIRNGRLVAVIDFGCMGIGDPACDLAIAWKYSA